MTVIGALVATYVRLSTRWKSQRATQWLSYRLMLSTTDACLLTVGLHPDHVLVGTPGWSPLRLIAVTVVLGIVGKFAISFKYNEVLDVKYYFDRACGFASGMEKAMKQILGEQSQLSPSIFRKPQAPRCLHRSLKGHRPTGL